MERDFLDYFLVSVQVLTLLALVVYVWKTWEMASATRSSVEEMKASRLAENRPYVLLFVERSSVSPLFMDLVLRNFGKTGARDITLTFGPRLQASWPGLSDCAFLSSPVGFLAPGTELRTFFDSSRDYFKKELPGHYAVEVTYQDERKQVSHAESIVLNIDQFKGMTWLDSKDLGDICKALESLGKSVDKTNGKLSDLETNFKHGLLTISASAEAGQEAMRQIVEGILAATACYSVTEDRDRMGEVAMDVQRLVAWRRQVALLLWSQVAQGAASDTQWDAFFEALNSVADFPWYMGAHDEFLRCITALKEQSEMVLGTLRTDATFEAD